jgi:glucose/arabinose dehydrogenase
VILLALGVAAIAWAGAARAAGPRLVPIGTGLQGPQGWKATVAVSGLSQVSALALDGRGRLWATTAGATNHRSDGVYLVAVGKQPVRVVAGLTTPLGLVWKRDVLFVSSLGRVTAFSRLHGTTFAQRTTIVDGPARKAENNNLVLAPNGRLVMGVSATCDHCRAPARWSADIVSFNTDGSGLRAYARRVRAAYGLAFVPGTGSLLATLNQRNDLGARTPGDWLSLVGPGSDWGFPGCYGQGGRSCTGVPAPLAILDPHAAAGGVAVGPLARTSGRSALVAEWARGRVVRVALTLHESTVQDVPTTFLTGFRKPLPILLRPDGSVLVGDWGSGKVYRIWHP